MQVIWCTAILVFASTEDDNPCSTGVEGLEKMLRATPPLRPVYLEPVNITTPTFRPVLRATLEAEQAQIEKRDDGRLRKSQSSLATSLQPYLCILSFSKRPNGDP
jgi:hypothetical protein